MKNKLKYQISKNLTISQVTIRKNLRKQARRFRGKILDLGCGTGEYSFILAKNNNQVVALDNSKELCQKLEKEIKQRNICNIKVVQADAHKLPFKNNTFDTCFCNEVVEHVRDDKQLIREIKRVLKPKGCLLISTPFLQEVHSDPDDFRRYTPYGFRELLEKYGFKVTKQFCDYGALNTIEYLLLGSFVWRLRIGFRKNFPLGYIYILLLISMFGLTKFLNWLFKFARKYDTHFATQISILAKKI